MINDRLLNAGEVTLAVRDFGGAGRPVVLLHGAASNLVAMTPLARRLRSAHRVVSVDLRGHGRSADGPWTFDAVLDDLDAVVRHLDLDRPAVVGGSLGGMVAVRWAARHPDCPGAVSLDGTPPPTRPDQLAGLDPTRAEAELARLRTALAGLAGHFGAPIDAEQLAALVQGQREAARRAGGPEKLWVESLRRNVAQQDGRTVLRPSRQTVEQIQAAMTGIDLPALYAAVRCPLLVVLATRDLPERREYADLYAGYRRWFGERVAAAARANPRLRYAHLADASHAMLDEHPDRIAALVTDFLAHT